MFDNIGDKIKFLSKITCWIGIISSFLIGIAFINNYYVGIGFLIMVLGALASWIGSFVTYGFGQLIENSDILVDNTEKLFSMQSSSVPSATTSDTASIKPAKANPLQMESTWRCSVCGNMISEDPCPHCHKKAEPTVSSGRALCPHCNKKIIIPEGIVNPKCPWCNNEILQ